MVRYESASGKFFAEIELGLFRNKVTSSFHVTPTYRWSRKGTWRSFAIQCDLVDLWEEAYQIGRDLEDGR